FLSEQEYSNKWSAAAIVNEIMALNIIVWLKHFLKITFLFASKAYLIFKANAFPLSFNSIYLRHEKNHFLYRACFGMLSYLCSNLHPCRFFARLPHAIARCF